MYPSSQKLFMITHRIENKIFLALPNPLSRILTQKSWKIKFRKFGMKIGRFCVWFELPRPFVCEVWVESGSVSFLLPDTWNPLLNSSNCYLIVSARTWIISNWCCLIWWLEFPGFPIWWLESFAYYFSAYAQYGCVNRWLWGQMTIRCVWWITTFTQPSSL